MEKKVYLVAVKKDNDGNAESVYQVQNATKCEFQSLKNQENIAIQKQRIKEQNLLNRIELLEQEILSLKAEIRWLKGEEEETESEEDEDESI